MCCRTRLLIPGAHTQGYPPKWFSRALQHTHIFLKPPWQPLRSLPAASRQLLLASKTASSSVVAAGCGKRAMLYMLDAADGLLTRAQLLLLLLLLLLRA